MMEESVYNLIPKTEEVPDKKPMYRSKFPGTIPPTASTFCTKNTSKPGVTNLGGKFVDPDTDGGAHKMKQATATLGKEHKSTISTDKFLRKREKESTMPPPTKFVYGDEGIRKPPVPKKDEKPIMGLVTTKNFIVSNAVDAILAVPKKPVDNTINYMKKSDFGKVPEYLKKIKKEIQEEYQYISNLQTAHENMEKNRMRLMTEEERETLLNGLKANLDKVHQKYQALSFVVDTPAKVKRKESLEAEMESLEKDIEKLSKKAIYIYDDEQLSEQE